MTSVTMEVYCARDRRQHFKKAASSYTRLGASRVDITELANQIGERALRYPDP